MRRIVRDYNPIKITEKNLIQEFKKRYPDRPIPTQVVKIPAHFPKHYPIFSHFLCDEEGRIFVRTHERDKQDYILYDVFDSDGRYFAKFAHPYEESMAAIKNKKMYFLIRTNKDGIPLVKRYKMEWK